METPSLTGNLYIHGAWTPGAGTPFSSVNPKTGAPVLGSQSATPDQVHAAVEAAVSAYGTYKYSTYEARARFLEDVADELEALGDGLLQICDQETGLGLPRLTGERGRTANQLRMFASLLREGSWVDARIDTADPDRKLLPKPDVRRMEVPLGPVAVFSASNFPLAFATLGGDTASALAAGNPVVVKGHPSHPATTELCSRAMAAAIRKNNLPPGVFGMVQGTDPKVSEALVKDPGIQAVGFTGSNRVGRILYDMGASRPQPIPVYAEMGSSNPLFILPSALKARPEALASQLAGSITLGTGQFCTKPGLIFVIDDPALEAFREKLAGALRQQARGTLLNENIRNGLQQRFHALQETGQVQQVTGGAMVEEAYAEAEHSLYAIRAEEFIGNPGLEEEIFGPAALLVVCKDAAEMERAAGSLSGHLTGTLHTDDPAEARTLHQILEEKVGRLIYNGVPTGVEVCASMHHGGPYPSTTFPYATSVGTAAIHRFCKVVCYQDTPAEHLPEPLKNENPLGILRMVNGAYTRDAVTG